MIKRILLLAAALVLAATPGVAQAQGYDGDGNFIAVSDTTVVAGGTVTISGCCFVGDVTIDILSTPRRLGTATADGDGVFTATVTIPTDITPGEHTITATGQNADGSGTLVLRFPITVLGAGAADGVRAGTGTGALPRTGADAFPLAQGGLALVLVGAAAVLSVRNRRNADRPADEVSVSA
jgi:LPXTG-motif cell wall-anchored protein